MPVLTAFADHPTHPYVRVVANWADTPSVDYAAVYRVDVATGECTPLRPYICYNGWELLLSCGHGTWWDTEAPFDRPFYYISTSSQAPCIPATTYLSDIFNRELVDSWGSTDTGQAYTLSGGTNPGNYDVTLGAGLHTLDSVNVRRHSFAFTGQTDLNYYVDCSIPVASPTGAGVTQWALARLTDVNNWYAARLEVTTAGNVTLTLAKRVATLVTDLTAATTVGTGHVAAEWWRIRINVDGSTIQGKAWRVNDTEPSAWQLTTTDTDLPTGTGVGMADRLEPGNLNSPLVSSWDNALVGDPCAPCTPVTASAPTEITLASDGRFWLKDPVRPCHDRPVPLCPTGAPVSAVCGGPSGILFISMGPETYASNSYTLRPMNRRRSISATRPRSDSTSALKLQTVTFTDRDDVLQLLAPGSPLLFQGPQEYGVTDRYMNIGDVPVAPPLPDLRVQFRSFVLPHDVEDRPAGPTQGICGARVADICALYPTWGDLAATGMTWDDLVAGQASPESANPDLRTWGDVNADFADWGAVNTGGRTWQQLQAGG